MAKRTKAARTNKPADADSKRAWLANHRNRFTTTREGAAGLQSEFGSALSFAEIANILAGREARAGFGSSGNRRKKVRSQPGPARAPKNTGARAIKKATNATRPQWIVAVPGIGRGWQIATFANKDAAAAHANHLLVAGKAAAKINIFQAVEFDVKTTATIAL